MSENVPNYCDKFKAQALSNPAKLLRAYMAATGISDAKKIATDLDIPIRTIQRLKLEVACATDGVASATANSANDAIYGAANSANDAIYGAVQTSDKKVSPTPPSKNNNTTTTVLPRTPREEDRPDGYAELKATFNGSTDAMIRDVQTYLAPYGDRTSAVKWLGGTLEAFGKSRTAQAWTMIVAKVAQGEDIRRALSLWAKTANGLKDDPVAAQAAVDNPFAAMTVGVVKHARPAPGSVRMPEVARA